MNEFHMDDDFFAGFALKSAIFRFSGILWDSGASYHGNWIQLVKSATHVSRRRPFLESGHTNHARSSEEGRCGELEMCMRDNTVVLAILFGSSRKCCDKELVP